jgi:hypothetical protein
MNTAEQSQGREIGTAAVAERMAALMEGPQTKPTPAQRDEAPAEANEAEATGYDGDETSFDDETQADYQAQSEDEAPEYSADEDGQAEERDPASQIVTVKIDGKTEEITLKEALEGYQRQADYSRKMHQLRQEQTHFVQERQQVEAERNQYGQLINALHDQLQQFAVHEPNWEQLHREDPLNFPIVEKQWRDYKERLAATQAERERLALHSQHQEQQHLQQVVEQGKNWLVERMPEWKDEQKWTKARDSLKTYGQQIGYSSEELGQAYDPRAILVLEKARRYDALVANRPKPTQNGQQPKPMRAGTTGQAPSKQTDVVRAKQRLSKTGSVDDAAKLFMLQDTRR